MYIKTEAIVLKRSNFGEADRIVTFYTKDFGKATALAKGVRRPRSRKGGHIELANWCKIFIAKGKNLDILTEVELKKSFGAENFTHEKLNKICHVLEIIESLTPEHQKNLEVYHLLVTYLNRISTEEDFNLLSSVFKIKILSSLGFFSSKHLKDSKTKKILEILEDEKFEDIKRTINLSTPSYLKLLSFLDSMIENVTQTKIKTNRFL